MEENGERIERRERGKRMICYCPEEAIREARESFSDGLCVLPSFTGRLEKNGFSRQESQITDSGTILAYVSSTDQSRWIE